MRSLTTKEKIVSYLRTYEGAAISGTELESCAEAWQTKASVISRRCRELVNEGKINRSLSPKKTVQYSYNMSRSLSTQEANQLLRELQSVNL